MTTCKVLPLTYPWKKGRVSLGEFCRLFQIPEKFWDIDIIVLVKNKEQQRSNIVSFLPLLLPLNISSLHIFEEREQNFPSVDVLSLMPVHICEFFFYLLAGSVCTWKRAQIS